MVNTEELFGIKNPWEEVAAMYDLQENDCLFSKNACYACEGDKDAINKFNEKVKGTSDEIITNIPAEPWWGNPLKASLIILSLNPGYVPEVNEKLAKLLQSSNTVREQLINYKAKTLRLEAEALLPKDEKTEPISCKDAVNMLGDWYWYRMLKRVRAEVGIEDEFFKKIALIEYHGYSSETSNRTFPLKNKYLKSQEFIRELIHYIAQKDNVLFLIMRSAEKWKGLLNSNSNNPNFFENYKTKFLCKTNKGMSQAITHNNLGDVYEKIKDLF